MRNLRVHLVSQKSPESDLAVGVGLFHAYYIVCCVLPFSAVAHLFTELYLVPLDADCIRIYTLMRPLRESLSSVRTNDVIGSRSCSASIVIPCHGIYARMSVPAISIHQPRNHTDRVCTTKLTSVRDPVPVYFYGVWEERKCVEFVLATHLSEHLVT